MPTPPASPIAQSSSQALCSSPTAQPALFSSSPQPGKRINNIKIDGISKPIQTHTVIPEISRRLICAKSKKEIPLEIIPNSTIEKPNTSSGKSRKIRFVIKQDLRLILGSDSEQEHQSHSSLANGGTIYSTHTAPSVLAAGMLELNANNKVIGFSNGSGHYHPSADSLWLCVAALQMLGYKEDDINIMTCKIVTPTNMTTEPIGALSTWLDHTCNTRSCSDINKVKDAMTIKKQADDIEKQRRNEAAGSSAGASSGGAAGPRRAAAALPQLTLCSGGAGAGQFSAFAPPTVYEGSAQKNRLNRLRTGLYNNDGEDGNDNSPQQPKKKQRTHSGPGGGKRTQLVAKQSVNTLATPQAYNFSASAESFTV